MNVALPLLALCFAAAQTPVKDQVIDSARAWTMIEDIVHTFYYASNSRRSEVDEILAKYASKAKAANLQMAFAAEIRAMMKEFGDSHFDFITKHNQRYYLCEGVIPNNESYPSIGAWFREINGQYSIQMIFEKGAAARAGLRKGDQVVSVNGAPFTPIDSLRSLVGTRARFVMVRANKPFKAELEVTSSKGFEPLLGATRSSIKLLQRKNQSVGYIHLWAMANEAFRQILSESVYQTFRACDGIILDLRDGFGGVPTGYADPFFRPDTSPSWKFASGTKDLQRSGYVKPVVVLVNEGTRSAKEVVSFLLQKTGRATLVGEKTAGHVLSSGLVPFDDWAVILIPTSECLVEGVRLEGRGVSPDIVVEPEFDQKGNDRVLAKALEVIAVKCQRPPIG